MKTLVLSSHQHGPATGCESVKQSLTSTNQKRKWGKRKWDRIEAVFVHYFWVITSISICMLLVGVYRVYAFGQDCKFRPQWYDQPACWVLTQVMSESPTIDPDKVIINDLDID